MCLWVHESFYMYLFNILVTFLSYLCRLIKYSFVSSHLIWLTSISMFYIWMNSVSKINPKKKNVLWQVIDDHILMNCSLCGGTMNFIIHGSLSFSFWCFIFHLLSFSHSLAMKNASRKFSDLVIFPIYFFENWCHKNECVDGRITPQTSLSVCFFSLLESIHSVSWMCLTL